jgi:hypothetical protein
VEHDCTDQKHLISLKGDAKRRRMDESSELLENIKTDKDAIFDSEIKHQTDDIENTSWLQILEWELVFLKVSRMPASWWWWLKSLAYRV